MPPTLKKGFFLRPVMVMLVLIGLSGCAGQQRDSSQTTYVCVPQFALPANTTVPVQELDVPAPSQSIIVANAGEVMISHGAYSLVNTARVVSDDDLSFMYPTILGFTSPRGQETLPEWVDDALSRRQLRALESAGDCGHRTIAASTDNITALAALDDVVAALPSSKQSAFGLLQTRPGLAARGDLIETEQGTFVTGLRDRFLPLTRKGEWQPWPGLAQTPLALTGLFVPTNASLPLLLQLDDRGNSMLVPAYGSVSFKDSVQRPVRREPLPGMLEQTLVYQGLEGSRAIFSYRRRAAGSDGSEVVQRFAHDVNRGSLVTYRGTQFEIIEATPRQIRYRLFSSFTSLPAFARPQ